MQSNSQIAIVVLKNNKTQEGSSLPESFTHLPALTKINLIKKKIEQISEFLTTQAPDAMWIISWHEYFINDGKQKRAIGPEAKKALKEVMLNLVNHFPNLTIIAGATSFKKRYTDPKKIEEVEKRYSQLAPIIADQEKWALTLQNPAQLYSG